MTTPEQIKRRSVNYMTAIIIIGAAVSVAASIYYSNVGVAVDSDPSSDDEKCIN